MGRPQPGILRTRSAREPAAQELGEAAPRCRRLFAPRPRQPRLALADGRRHDPSRLSGIGQPVGGAVRPYPRGGRGRTPARLGILQPRSEEHTSELQSLMRISYAVFCLKKKKQQNITHKQRKHTQTLTPHYLETVDKS